MDFGILEIAIALVTILIVLYSYNSWSYDYWKKLGVPGPKATIPFGNFADIFLRRKTTPAKLQEIYNYDESSGLIGYYIGSKPILMIKDPDIIKNVLIKDFNVFSGRGIKINEKNEPLSAHLFNLDGPRWKTIRHKLTPVFTTGKLRHMFGLMSDCADTFENYLKAQVSRDGAIECREKAARFTTDVIGSCAFGLDTQALADEDSIFRNIGRQIFQPSLATIMKRLMRDISPRFYSLFRFTSVRPAVVKFFSDTMRETVELRKREKITRNDLIDVLMDISKDANDDGFEWTNDLLTAQAFVFFLAGFETSSTTIAFALWELSRCHEAQEKLRREIIEFYADKSAKITYENVNDMRYLDMVIKETLRKNPPVVALIRKAMQDYTIGGTSVTIKAGQRVQIPAYSLHRDPKYFSKPEIFEPERFTDEAKLTRHPMVYLPFGDGPKNCIGSRFAYYQVKLALIKILKNFRVRSMTSDNEPYVIDINSIILAPVGGIVLKFEPLEN